jgi:hypothetical protein
MKSVVFLRTLSVLIFLVCTMAFASSCKREMSGTAITGQTEISEMTEQTIPTPTPTPKPSSIDMPIEEPQDIPLFEEGYYAVLQGEGANYNVFDCYGNPVGNFLYYGSDNYRPRGIMSEKQLTYLYRFYQKDIQTVLPLNDKSGFSTLHSSLNGFYQVDEIEGQVALYNTEGKHIQTLTCPWDVGDYVPIIVTCYGDETVVSFSKIDSSTKTRSRAIYFVALDGTINDTCIFKGIDDYVVGILGRKYIVVSNEYGEQDCDLYDTDGILVKENVSIAHWYHQSVSYPKWDFLDVFDYYTSDEQTFDASFQPVKKNTVEADGALICGVEYDVEGITCKAEYFRGGYYLEGRWIDQELIAVGTSGDQMAIKTTEEEYVITCNDLKFYAINMHVLVLLDSQGAYQVVSLDTGAVLYTIENGDYFEVANEYIYIFREDYNNELGISCFVIDKDGNARFSSQNAYCSSTLGENIILYRGPYFGIANLDGEWLIKTLNIELKRDAKQAYEY